MAGESFDIYSQREPLLALAFLIDVKTFFMRGGHLKEFPIDLGVRCGSNYVSSKESAKKRQLLFRIFVVAEF